MGLVSPCGCNIDFVENPFLDQLHNFSLSSSNSVLHPVMKTKFLKKNPWHQNKKLIRVGKGITTNNFDIFLVIYLFLNNSNRRLEHWLHGKREFLVVFSVSRTWPWTRPNSNLVRKIVICKTTHLNVSAKATHEGKICPKMECLILTKPWFFRQEFGFESLT